MLLLIELVKKNKKISLYILISFIVILGFIGYLISNISYSSSNINKYSDKEKLRLITTKINELNLSLNSTISNNTLDTKLASTKLASIISELNNCNLTLSNLELNQPDYIDVKNKLILCINSTNDLYNYCNNCLTNSEKDSMEVITDTLEQLKNECITDYTNLSIYEFQIKYTDTMDSFLSALIRYLSSLNKVTLNKEIQKNSVEAFKKTLFSSTNEFSKLLEDLQPALLKIREDNRSLDILLEDILCKEEKFNDIQTNFAYISIPNGYLSYYNYLIEAFNSYSNYLTAIKIAIIYEKSSVSYSKDKKAIDKNYKNAFQKYNDALNSYNYVQQSQKNL